MTRRFPTHLVPLFLLPFTLGLTLFFYNKAAADSDRHHDSCKKAHDGIPPALSVPADECLVESVEAEGVQIYSCVNTAWVLKAPEANLAQHGRFVGNHFLGPTWQWKDGSKVKAAKTASAPGPTAGDIPQLLLTVTRSDGDGVLEGVKHIQRLSTSGGSAPVTACIGIEDLVVPYKATYLFYKTKKR